MAGPTVGECNNAGCNTVECIMVERYIAGCNMEECSMVECNRGRCNMRVYHGRVV